MLAAPLGAGYVSASPHRPAPRLSGRIDSKRSHARGRRFGVREEARKVRQVPMAVTVNGVRHERAVEPRLLLSDFLRHDLGLTGTHVGCEHGVCGACTVLLDGEAVRSCLMFAAQADGHVITTVEGLAPPSPPQGARDTLHPLQVAFRETHALQCGFCTPGFLMTLVPFLRDHPSPGEREIREALSGNLCRCTGYQNIVAAVVLACDTSPRR
jgi:carbon-monoxide dehydrogenase small subunit